MSEIEKGLRAILAAIRANGEKLEQIRFLLAAEVDYLDNRPSVDEIVRRQADTGSDPTVKPAVRTFDPDRVAAVEE